MSKNIYDEASLLDRANHIIKMIKTLEVTLKPESPQDFDDVMHLNIHLNQYDLADANSVDISNEDAKTITQMYNSLLSRGAVIKNTDSSENYQDIEKENKSLKEKVETLKAQVIELTKEKYELKGKLSEYRRMYGTNDSFTSEVVEDESS